MLLESSVPFGPEIPSNTTKGIPEQIPWWEFVSELLSAFYGLCYSLICKLFFI